MGEIQPTDHWQVIECGIELYLSIWREALLLTAKKYVAYSPNGMHMGCVYLEEVPFSNLHKDTQWIRYSSVCSFRDKPCESNHHFRFYHASCSCELGNQRQSFVLLNAKFLIRPLGYSLKRFPWCLLYPGIILKEKSLEFWTKWILCSFRNKQSSWTGGFKRFQFWRKILSDQNSQWSEPRAGHHALSFLLALWIC